MIKVILFDFGGVLTETGKSGFVRQALADVYGVKLEDIQLGRMQYEWRKNVKDEDQVLDMLNKQFGKHVTAKQFYEHLSSDTVPSEAVYKLATEIRATGIKTGILSNIFSTSAGIIRAQGFYDNFDPVVLSCEEGYAKPDPELYRIAVKKSGVQPDEILFIDDQKKCRPPAEQVGMQFLLATSPQQIVADTKAILKAQNGLEL
jgi:epoxide hydrolase-like predicted phosphatase